MLYINYIDLAVDPFLGAFVGLGAVRRGARVGGERGGDILASMLWISDLHALNIGSLCLKYRISMP